MFRSLSGDGQSSAAGRGGASPGLHSQESSWIGLLSRPAVSFLQRYLPGRPRAPARPDPGAGWIRGDLKSSFADEEREFLRQLDDMMPLTQHAAPHLAYLRCQHDGAAGLLEPGGGGTLPWLTADSLREIGIQSAEDMDLTLCQQTQIGYLSSFRTFFSQVLLSSVSSQEVRPSAGGADWEPGKTSRTWWGSLLGGEGASQRGLLSDLSWVEDGTATGPLCPQQQVKVPETTDNRTPGEHTGETPHKEQLDNNGGLHTVQNTEGSTPHQLSVSEHLSGAPAATCTEAAPLTPDQDNGYSSLEEEHFQVNVVKEPSEEDQEAADNMPMEDQDPAPQEAGPQDPGPQEAPQCQNKAIAFIMGCPCSDDDSSQSEGESTDDDDDDDDDDGFDSEGSSESDSTDEDDEEEDEGSDSEADSDSDRLWSSLCHSVDPYNPRNFTARLSSAPRTVPGSTPPSSTQSTPDSSPDLTPAPLTSSSPPSGPDSWDESTSASEADEAESLRLLSSFSCSSDPYSPFNFQAPLRTRVPVEAGPRTRTRTKKVPQTLPRHTAASPPEYRREEAEERLDSGFSEPSTSAQSCCSAKKVRFRDDVEEFFASCGEEEEDRRGPWEELARDRCRFLRRCQEVEQSIAYCLQPQHRRLVYRRLAATVLHN